MQRIRFRVPPSARKLLGGVGIVAAVVLVVLAVRWLIRRRRENWQFAKRGKRVIKEVHKKQIRDRCRMGISWTDFMANPSFAHLSQYDGDVAWNICKGAKQANAKGPPKDPKARGVKCLGNHGYCPSRSIGRDRPCLNQNKTQCCKPNLKDCRPNVITQQDREWDAADAVAQGYGAAQPAAKNTAAKNTGATNTTLQNRLNRNTGAANTWAEHKPGGAKNKAKNVGGCRYFARSYDGAKWQCYPGYIDTGRDDLSCAVTKPCADKLLPATGTVSDPSGWRPEFKPNGAKNKAKVANGCLYYTQSYTTDGKWQCYPGYTKVDRTGINLDKKIECAKTKPCADKARAMGTPVAGERGDKAIVEYNNGTILDVIWNQSKGSEPQDRGLNDNKAGGIKRIWIPGGKALCVKNRGRMNGADNAQYFDAQTAGRHVTPNDPDTIDDIWMISPGDNCGKNTLNLFGKYTLT